MALFLMFIYLISAITWGLVLFDMVRATYISIVKKTETPRLLVPLAIASLALVIESVYFLVANIFRYFGGDTSYFVFMEEDNLFIIKIGIALAGVMMSLKLRSERKKYM